jgi:hypothetical protein
MIEPRAADIPPVAGPGGKDLLWFIAQRTAGAVGERFFERLVKRIAQAFAADVAFVAEMVPGDRERAPSSGPSQDSAASPTGLRRSAGHSSSVATQDRAPK